MSDPVLSIPWANGSAIAGWFAGDNGEGAFDRNNTRSSACVVMRPSTILFLAANPAQLPELRLDEECRTIEDELYKAKFRDQIRFRSRWAARPDDLMKALNDDSPSVLHFSGHGAGEQGLWFLSEEDDSPVSVSAECLGQVMRTAGKRVTIAVLNACYSEVQAQALVAHIPCVMGTSAAIGDKAAIIYAGSLYRALASGESVADAHEQGIASLGLHTATRRVRDINS